jgi:hypothetical protein
MTSFGIVVYNINQASFRQLLCPPRLLGRMNATMRFLVWGTLPLGGLLGGVLGSWLGDRNAIWVAVTGEALTPMWLLLSPLIRGTAANEADDASPGAGSHKTHPARP